MLPSVGLVLSKISRFREQYVRVRRAQKAERCAKPYALKRKAPEMPPDLNGSHSALWGFLTHLNQRVDALYTLGAGAALALLGISIGILVAVLVK